MTAVLRATALVPYEQVLIYSSKTGNKQLSTAAGATVSFTADYTVPASGHYDIYIPLYVTNTGVTADQAETVTVNIAAVNSADAVVASSSVTFAHFTNAVTSRTGDLVIPLRNMIRGTVLSKISITIGRVLETANAGTGTVIVYAPQNEAIRIRKTG
jgi:hypothetical protein